MTDPTDLYEQLLHGRVSFQGDPSQPLDYLRSMHSPSEPLDYTPNVPYLSPRREASPPTMEQPPAAAMRMDEGSSGRAARMDERTGRPGYEAIVSDYLESLDRPVELPRPRPLSPAQALLVGLNPGRRQELMSEFRQPYDLALREMDINERRRGQRAEMASRLADREYQRDWQERQQEYAREQILANAGTYPYNYRNPQLGALAETRAKLNESLINSRGRRTGKLPPTRADAIESTMKDIARVQGSMGQPSVTEPILRGQGFPQKKDASEMWDAGMKEYRALTAMLDMLRHMDDAQYQQWIALPGQEQMMAVEAWQRDEPEAPPIDPLGTYEDAYR